MKTFSEYKNTPKRQQIKESASPQYTLFPKDKKELKDMIDREIKKHGNNADLNHIDIRKIADLYYKVQENLEIFSFGDELH